MSLCLSLFAFIQCVCVYVPSYAKYELAYPDFGLGTRRHPLYQGGASASGCLRTIFFSRGGSNCTDNTVQCSHRFHKDTQVHILCRYSVPVCVHVSLCLHTHVSLCRHSACMCLWLCLHGFIQCVRVSLSVTSNIVCVYGFIQSVCVSLCVNP